MAAHERIHGYVHTEGSFRWGMGSYVVGDGDNVIAPAYELSVTSESGNGNSSGNTIAVSPELARKLFIQLGQLIFKEIEPDKVTNTD